MHFSENLGVPVDVSQPVNSMLSMILCGRCAGFPKIVCLRDLQMSILLLSYLSSLFERYCLEE